MKKPALFWLFLIAFLAPMRPLHAQCLNAQAPNQDTQCDLTTNDPQLWNAPVFNDSLVGTDDLADAPVDLSFTVQNICGSGLVFSFVLFLDLDGDGQRESALNSDDLLPNGQIRFNNAANPGYTGGQIVSFDTRAVPADQRYQFVLKIDTAGDMYTARLRWHTAAAPNTHLVPMLPYGHHQMAWKAQRNTEITTAETPVTLKDCKKPTVVCINGLSANLMPTAQITLWATDFLQYTEDNHSPTHLLRIGIRKAGTGTGFPVDTSGAPLASVTYTCTEVGTHLVELWTEDRYGNADFCQTFVIIQNNLNVNCPLQVEIIRVNGPSCNVGSGLLVQATGGTAPYSYAWSNGNTVPFFTSPPVGFYTVTVTDVNGNSGTASYFVETKPANCAELVGRLGADFNANCLAESGEPSLAGVTLKIENTQGDDFFTQTDTAGVYRILLAPGQYTVAPLPPSPVWAPCPTPPAVTLAAGDSLVQDVPLQALANCPSLHVDLTTSFLRRCFLSKYFVHYRNDGSAPAEDAYVIVELDPFLQLQGAQLPPIALGNNTYRFELGDLPLDAQGRFWIEVYVSCDAALGQTHCSEAHIYPDTLCLPPNSAWSGASLRLDADCDADSLRFTITNIGAGTMSEAAEYLVLEDIVMLRSGTVTPLLPGGSMVVAVPANGATWRLEVDQEPFHPGLSAPAITVEGCPTGIPVVSGLVNQLPPDDADPWIDIECVENIGAFDPNDKLGIPEGYGPQHYIRPGTEIEYRIRFQNTGTDTAFTVVIRDELSPWLDPGSVQPGASSHPYRFDYYDGNKLKFTFDNILLPDSNVNEPASHGFVKFRVRQKADVPLETDIFNQAAIFFDFNAPIWTNTTTHRVGENFLLVSTWDPQRPEFDLLVAPNPTTDAAWLRLEGLPAGVDWQLDICSLDGRLIQRLQANGPTLRFERGALRAGAYLLRAAGRDGVLLGTGKLLVR